MKRYSRFGESGSARWLFPARDVAELLTGNRRRSHQTAFGDGEHQHSLLEAAARGRGIVFSAARARGRSRSTRAGGGTRSDGDGASPRGKFKGTRLELVECALILEENDLAVCLAAGLEARAELRHGRIADKFITHVHPAFAMCATDNEARLTYGWKSRIRVTHGKV